MENNSKSQLLNSKLLLLFFISAIICCFVPSVSEAETAVIQGTDYVAGTSLCRSSVDSNWGANGSLHVGADGYLAQEFSCLIKFNLSEIPSCSMIISARLHLYYQGGYPNQLNMGIYRMLAPWNQGNKNGTTGTDSETTYSYKLYKSTVWNWDYDADWSSCSTLTIANGENIGWKSVDVTRFAAGWIRDPSANNGLLLMDNSTGYGNRKSFGSIKNESTAYRPYLEVEYEPPFTESTEVTGGTARLVGGASTSMPRVNTTVTLHAKAPGWSGSNLTFTFTAIPANFSGSSIQIGTQSAAGETLVSQNWTPAQSGLYNILVEVNEATILKKYMRMAVTTSDLEFPFSHYDTAISSSYVTTVQDANHVEFWKARGVSPYVWYPGTYMIEAGWTSAQLLNFWDSVWTGNNAFCDGAMIDELYGSTDDIATCQAINSYHSNHPERKIYCYLPSVYSNSTVLQALQNSTALNLLEAYTENATAYSIFNLKWASIESNGLSDKTIAVLMLTPFITSDTELRRQIRYMRRMVPDMKGLMIYAIPGTPSLYNNINDIIESYYLNPVLLLNLQGTTLNIANIGQTKSTGYSVISYNVQGNQLSSSGPYDLNAQSNTNVTVPSGTSSVKITSTNTWNTVLYSSEDYANIPSGQPQPLSTALTTMNRSCNFSADPGLTVHTDTQNRIDSATYNIVPNDGNSVTMSFDMNFTSIYYYGFVKVGLGNSIDGAGKNQLQLTFNKTDNDGDITGCRATLRYLNPNGTEVRELMFRALTTGTTYKFYLHYEKDNSVRAMCYDQSGVLIWDTGNLSVSGMGGLFVDRARFDVCPAAGSTGSKIEITNSQLHLRGKNASDASYVIDSNVDNIAVSYLQHGSGSTYDFASDPGLAIHTDSQGRVDSAAYDIAQNSGNSVSMSFDLDFPSIYYYGSIEVGLGNKTDGAGKNQFKLTFCKSDNENNISGCRATMRYYSPSGTCVTSSMPLTAQYSLDTTKSYRFTIQYEKNSFVRALCYDQNGVLVWDTGKQSVSGLGGLYIDSTRFDVTPCAGTDASAVTITGGKLFLLGHNPAHPYYIIRGNVDNIAISVLN